MAQLRTYLKQVYGDETPAFLPAEPLDLDISWKELMDLPLDKLLQARTKLLCQDVDVRKAIFADQPDHILKAWESDLEEREPFIGPIRLDCVVTSEQEVFCNEIDLLPGGTGIVIALEKYFYDGDSPTLDAYCHYLERMKVKCLALVALSTELDLLYLPERIYLAERCRERGLSVWAVDARQLQWHSDGPFLPGGEKITHIDRFYSGWQLSADDPLWRLAEFGVIEMPPLNKEYLEGKLWDALLWDPHYRSFWEEEIGSHFHRFLQLIPETYSLKEYQDRVSPIFANSSETQNWIIKEGASSVSSNWGSRSVNRLSNLSNTDLNQLIYSLQDPNQYVFEINGWKPVSPIIQKFIRSDLFSVPLKGGGLHKGQLRCSPFYWLDRQDFSRSKGLATVRPNDIVFDTSDALMTINASA